MKQGPYSFYCGGLNEETEMLNKYKIEISLEYCSKKHDESADLQLNSTDTKFYKKKQESCLKKAKLSTDVMF